MRLYLYALDDGRHPIKWHPAKNEDVARRKLKSLIEAWCIKHPLFPLSGYTRGWIDEDGVEHIDFGSHRVFGLIKKGEN